MAWRSFAQARRGRGCASHVLCSTATATTAATADSSLTLWTTSSPRWTVIATTRTTWWPAVAAPTAKVDGLPNVSDQGLDMTPRQSEYLSDQTCCQLGLQGVDVTGAAGSAAVAEQVSDDRRGSSGNGPAAGGTARGVDRVFSATA